MEKTFGGSAAGCAPALGAGSVGCAKERGLGVGKPPRQVSGTAVTSP